MMKLFLLGHIAILVASCSSQNQRSPQFSIMREEYKQSISIENQEFLPPSAETSWRKDSYIKNRALQFWISYNKAIQDTNRNRAQRELKKIIKEQGISILLISPMTPSMREI